MRDIPDAAVGGGGIVDRDGGGLDLGVPGRVDGAVDCLRDGGARGCEAVASLEHEVVVRGGGDVVWGGGVVGGGQEGVGQGLPEAGFVDEEVLGVVGGVVVGDFEDGCLLAFFFRGLDQRCSRWETYGLTPGRRKEKGGLTDL